MAIGKVSLGQCRSSYILQHMCHSCQGQAAAVAAFKLCDNAVDEEELSSAIWGEILGLRGGREDSRGDLGVLENGSGDGNALLLPA